QNKADQGATKTRSEVYFIVRRNDKSRSRGTHTKCGSGMQSQDAPPTGRCILTARKFPLP
ncbi:MAG: hypothetical protein V3T96_01920, partial [Thermodesulfobacteriota bacterium]